ncbi:MAG: hypothetical protein H2069_09585 [Legionella sp.]|nr:hypothetical protein [Legionella sp.]
MSRHQHSAVDEAVLKYGLRTEAQLRKFFRSSGVAYPPQEIALLAFKKERCIELWARNPKSIWRYIHTYPLTAFSGHLGPKLRENDGQIPEGVYHLTDFNPFSSMHLSILIDYPNGFDRTQAAKDGRRHLGNNIFLHGKSLSAGCLAVGDHAIDQLFLLARRVGLTNINLIIAPNDLRISKPATSPYAPPWAPKLYAQLKQSLRPFRY